MIARQGVGLDERYDLLARLVAPAVVPLLLAGAGGGVIRVLVSRAADQAVAAPRY